MLPFGAARLVGDATGDDDGDAVGIGDEAAGVVSDGGGGDDDDGDDDGNGDVGGCEVIPASFVERRSNVMGDRSTPSMGARCGAREAGGEGYDARTGCCDGMALWRGFGERVETRVRSGGTGCARGASRASRRRHRPRSIRAYAPSNEPCAPAAQSLPASRSR